MSLPGTLYLHCLLVMFKGLSMEDSEIRINGDRRNRMTISHINTELSVTKKNMTQGDELASTRKLQGNTVNKIPDVRRVEREVIYDAQLVHNISERALELCPYSDFCHLNGSELGANVWYGISCCKSCYCDVGCGDRMDCCFDFLDVVKVKEKNHLKCIKPLIEAKNKGKNMVFIFTQSYYMIDSCLSDSTYSCKNENSALWGSMYPVYSPSSKMIYVNHHCAECNGVRDANPWEVYINCNISDSISGTGLTNGIKYGRCSVQFRPANKGSVDRFACNGDVISSCNSTGRLDRTDQDLEEDQFLEDACALTRAEVITYAEGGIKVHANAFCKLCNGIKHYPHDVCIAPDDSIKMISNSLTTLIDWRVVSSFHHQKTLDQDQVDGPEECNTNEIKHPLKNNCRIINCPNGAIRTPQGCTLYTKTWYRNGYLIHLILTPVSEDFIPTDAFLRVIHEQEPNVKQWLDSKRIQVDSIVMSAELEAKQNVSYIRGLNMIIGQKVNTPLDSADLLETVQSSLKMRWRIKVDDKKYYCDVKFDKYLYFVQDGLSRRTHLLNKVNFSSIQPKRYDAIYVNRKPIPPLYITQMFFCELVTLLSDEWIPAYQGLWLNLTGTGNGTFLGDAEFNLRKTADDTWQVQICVEDFQSELANTVTSFANILSQRNPCLLFLYVCVICVTVNLNIR